MPTNPPGTVITGMDISAYFISDPARAIAFYKDVLGLVPTAEQERGAEFELSDGSTFGVWRGDDPAKTSGGAMMFAVGDVHAAVALFRSRGLGLSDPIESPVCFMSFGADPDGNPIIIHQRKQKT